MRSSGWRAAGDDFGCCGEGAIDAGAVYVVVRNHADGVSVGRTAENFVLAEIGADVVGGVAGGTNIENYDVGRNFLWIDCHTFDLGETFREIAGVLVVTMQDFRRFFQSDEPRSSKNSYLPHSAAQQLPPDVSFINEIARAKKHRADRGAESFREAEHHGIEFARKVGDAAAERDGRVEDSRPVEMYFEVGGMGVVADVVRNVLRIDGAAVHVVCVFEP